MAIIIHAGLLWRMWRLDDFLHAADEKFDRSECVFFINFSWCRPKILNYILRLTALPEFNAREYGERMVLESWKPFWANNHNKQDKSMKFLIPRRMRALTHPFTPFGSFIHCWIVGESGFIRLLFSNRCNSKAMIRFHNISRANQCY